MGDRYAIVGIAKLKTPGNIGGVLSHMMRTRPTPNADGRENLTLIAPPSLPEIMREIDLYPNKRSNSVLCFDILLTASPEAFDDMTPERVKDWAETSLQWACDKFGKDNIKGAVLHLDEMQTGSPHLQILSIAAYNNRLNARHFTGGRERLRAMWTEYAAAVKKFGLKRGREYSPAKHREIKAFYSDVKRGIELAAGRNFTPEELPAPTMADYLHPAEYATRLVNRVVVHYRKQNGNLRAALEATQKELERMTERTAADRQERQQLKVKPGLIKELQEALATEARATEAERGKYKTLVAAVKEYFKRNIGTHDALRKPDKLGALQDIPELADAVRLSLTPDSKERRGMERTM